MTPRVKFVAQSKVYHPHLPMMQVMFGACLRVSETIGLTWSDVDMKNRKIRVGGRPIMPAGVNLWYGKQTNLFSEKFVVNLW